MFKIEFETDNAAFENCSFEVARILTNIAQRIESGQFDGELLDGSLNMPVIDYNGNKVGRVTANAEDTSEV